MKNIINDDFLLSNKYAKALYHEHAKDIPIIDYHCHLIPQQIAEDKRFRSITEIWLDGDHYKWRAMRTAGYSEELITGCMNDPNYDEERFNIWAETVPLTIGNALYHWTHLELKRYFGIDLSVNKDTAHEIFKECNRIISSPEFSTHQLIKKFDVKFIGTTDDPMDSLEYHQSINLSSLECKVAPSFRPDKFLNIQFADEFVDYILKVSSEYQLSDITIDDIVSILEKKIQIFQKFECRASDHGLDEFVFNPNFTKIEVNTIIQKALQKNQLSRDEIIKYKSYLLLELGKLYHKHDIVMQLHVGALRRNNTKMFNRLGVDVGFDSINDRNYAIELSYFLDSLDKHDLLPRTILYNLNPNDNDMLSTMIGNFQGDGIRGKVQFGSGWWFNDQKSGMEKQLISLANHSLLPLFVGMLTDSRSFLSFSRHEYFRRILCNIVGKWVKEGLYPKDMVFLGQMIQNISYFNAKQYFKI